MSRGRAPKTVLPDDKARLNLLLDKDLKDWAKDYAAKNRTNLTALITRMFMQMKALDDGSRAEDIESSMRYVLAGEDDDLGIEQI